VTLYHALATGRFTIASRPPALSHLPIIRRMTPSVTRWSRISRRCECEIESASRFVLPRARLASGWLAFTGRESNPLDRCERFQIIRSSSSPVLLFS
jgi:hypothetical protein